MVSTFRHRITPIVSLCLVLGSACSAEACTSCQFDMIGPYAQHYLLALLGWMLAVACLGSYATHLEAQRGTRQPEAIRSPWGKILLVLLTCAFGGALLGPVVFLFWAVYFFVGSLVLLVKPKPVPTLSIALAVALVLTFKGIGLAGAKQVEAVGGEQMWILKSQRPHSRDMMRLGQESTPEHLEELLRQAEQRDDIPEANLKWLQNRVEHARS